ncbi:bis(5'-nucleosyl)-tetraphosphatase [Stieleria mannarensis]|uniref:bis(5'-nucleosyl)-tetraphosphatase n=1 Tax=Stieleria mannarensis TaxID=2755585 RepID=UPI0015FFE0D3|nr:NUDIX domain-containing protein [Rhodopirellula sp. JC639]
MPQPNQPPTKRAAGILLITRSKPRQFLLMRHHDRWDLPKGHCDRDESDLQTALRETEEETGLASDNIQIDSDFRFELSYPVRYKRHGEQTFLKTVVYLLGSVESAFTPTLTEHPGFRWFPWNPPHQIQTQTIDPLLQAVAEHLERSERQSAS